MVFVFDQVLGREMARLLLLVSCMCAAPLQGQRPGQVDPLTARRTNPQCWDSSSALLLEMKSPRIAVSVPAFWDLMVSLRSSVNSKHTALFWDLAGVFWDLYADCVLSRSHGLGRRHVTAAHSHTTDRSFKFNSSGSKSRLRLGFRMRRQGHIQTMKTKPEANAHNS